MPLESPYRNPYRWRAVVFHQEVRHGTAGCLLSLVLLAPLLTGVLGVELVLIGVLVYGCLVVPAVTNYFSPAKLLVRAARLILNGWPKCWSAVHTGLGASVGAILSRTWQCLLDVVKTLSQCLLLIVLLPFTLVFKVFLPLVHNFYLSFEGLRITSNQVVFFVLVERVVTPNARLAALYFLLFYTVLAYLHKSLYTRQWTQTVHSTNMRDFLKLTTWYIAVRLGKGVAMSFVLIMFTMQFNHVEPSLTYIAVTFVYFVVTQRKWTGNEPIINWIHYLGLPFMEEEEEFWVPLLLKVSPVVASVGMAVPLAETHWPLCGVAAYTNLVVPLLLARTEYEHHCATHTVLLQKFRRATSEELCGHSVCPVCLETLRVARVTPCGHLYHAACLRRCLAISHLCPMCKQRI